jgi:hypothetical protein
MKVEFSPPRRQDAKEEKAPFSEPTDSLFIFTVFLGVLASWR